VLCIRVLPLYPFDLPYFSSQLCKMTICGRLVMASVRDIKIAEALLVLYLACYVMKRVRHCWNWGVMAFTYWDMGRTFHKYIFRIFCNGWMDCRDAFHAVILLYNGQNIAEYEAYWLMSFSIINLWAHVSQAHFLLWLDGLQGYFPVLCLYCCVTNTTKLSTKHTGLSVFQ